jgi:hypothetical protein
VVRDWGCVNGKPETQQVKQLEEYDASFDQIK